MGGRIQVRCGDALLPRLSTTTVCRTVQEVEHRAEWRLEGRIISVFVYRDVKWGQGILYYPSGKYPAKLRLRNYYFLSRQDDVQWRDEE